MVSHLVYTVQLPNKLLTGVFVNYSDAVEWKDIMDGEQILLIYVDPETHDHIALLD